MEITPKFRGVCTELKLDTQAVLASVEEGEPSGGTHFAPCTEQRLISAPT